MATPASHPQSALDAVLNSVPVLGYAVVPTTLRGVLVVVLSCVVLVTLAYRLVKPRPVRAKPRCEVSPVKRPRNDASTPTSVATAAESDNDAAANANNKAVATSEADNVIDDAVPVSSDEEDSSDDEVSQDDAPRTPGRSARARGVVHPSPQRRRHPAPAPSPASAVVSPGPTAGAAPHTDNAAAVSTPSSHASSTRSPSKPARVILEPQDKSNRRMLESRPAFAAKITPEDVVWIRALGPHGVNFAARMRHWNIEFDPTDFLRSHAPRDEVPEVRHYSRAGTRSRAPRSTALPHPSAPLLPRTSAHVERAAASAGGRYGQRRTLRSTRSATTRATAGVASWRAMMAGEPTTRADGAVVAVPRRKRRGSTGSSQHPFAAAAAVMAAAAAAGATTQG